MRREKRPYLTLRASVLEEAIEELYYKPPKTRDDLTAYQDSVVERELYWKSKMKQWLKSKSKLFNCFAGICIILGLGPSCIRKGLCEKGSLSE